MPQPDEKTRQLVEDAISRIRDDFETCHEAELLEDLSLVESHHAWLRSELAALKAQLAEAEKERDELQGYYDRDTAKLKQEIERLIAANSGVFWRWQGDGGDYLESLTCPIMIDVGQLKQIFDVNTAATSRAERAEEKYNELAGRIDSYPRTCDVERIAQLTKVLGMCRNELAWLYEQTGAREGGSVWRAYQAATALLAQPEEGNDGK